MKLASLKGSGRDGELVSSTARSRAASPAPDIAATLQAALDRWTKLAPQLRRGGGAARVRQPPRTRGRFDARACAAPLPRAYQWVDGSAYLNHVELVRKARGAEMPASFWTDPLVYQGGSDEFLGPHRRRRRSSSEEYGIDLEAEVAVIDRRRADGHRPPRGRARGAHPARRCWSTTGACATSSRASSPRASASTSPSPPPPSRRSRSRPMSSAAAWRGGKLHLPLVSEINGALLGARMPGVDMTFNFSELIAHAARTRNLGAGTIVGSGTVANRDRPRLLLPGRAAHARAARVRPARTPFLKFGDRVRIEMLAASGASIFGAIDQRVVRFRAEPLGQRGIACDALMSAIHHPHGARRP